MSNRLTKQQEGFCQSYHKHGNAAQAYRENYSCKKMSSKVLWVKASELKDSGKVSVRLNELAEKASKRHEGLADRVLDQYVNLAFFDPSDYFEWTNDGVKIKDSSQLSKKQLAAISGVVESNTQFGRTIKISMESKKGALDSLARMLGLNQDSLKIIDQTQEDSELAKVAREKLLVISGGTKK